MTTPPPEKPSPVVFPLPPAVTRVQYLGSLSSKLDLPSTRSSFAEMVLGPETTTYRLAKPISALLRGTRLYVCDTVFNSVLVFDLATGDVHPLAGDHGVGKILQPNNMTIDDEGRIYVADKERRAVIVYGPNEQYIAAWGRPDQAKPTAVVVYGDEMFVCDTDEHEIEVWSRLDGSFIRKFGGIGAEPGKLKLPTFLALDSAGNLLVTDTGNFRVQKLSRKGEPLAVVGGHGITLGKFAWPKGLALDASDRLFVADSRFANVQIFNSAGQLLLFFGAPGPEGGNVDLPAGISVVPWPSIPWLESKLLPGFQPESLAIVVNQQAPYFINFFAVAKDGTTK